MDVVTRRLMLLAACAGVIIGAFTTQVQRRRRRDIRTHKANLHEWENEGGNLSPSSSATSAQPSGPAVE